MNRNSFNRRQGFDRQFDRQFDLMRRVFWIFFAVVATVIIAILISMGLGIYTVLTNPEAVGNITADVIRPIADAIRGE